MYMYVIYVDVYVKRYFAVLVAWCLVIGSFLQPTRAPKRLHCLMANQPNLPLNAPPPNRPFSKGNQWLIGP